MAPSGECLRGKSPPDRIIGKNLGAVCFWDPIPSGLNLVVAAVLRDSLCIVSLLPCVSDCCMPCVRLSGLSTIIINYHYYYYLFASPIEIVYFIIDVLQQGGRLQY